VEYSVRTARCADTDIEHVVTWIRRHVSPSSAAQWHTRTENAILSLSSNPQRCPEADEAAELGVNLRVLLTGRRRSVYRILFTIDGDTVNVLRVLHAARDRVKPEDLS
jgi:plasmid stabilization system protein ParE